MIRIVAAALACAVLLSFPASARTLSPAGDWQFGETDESCRLARAFGEGTDRTILQIQSYGPGTPYQIVASGSVFPIRDSRAIMLNVGFGGEAATEEVIGVLAEAGDRPLLRFAANPPRPASAFGRFYSYRPTSARLGASLDPSAEELFLDMPDMTPVTFPLGPMAEHYARLDQCAEGLAAKWQTTGDPIAQPPAVIDGQNLMTMIKYPQNLLLNRISGLVYLRMTVGPNGRARDCVVQAPNWGSRFEKDTCRTFEQKAHFEPARDARGDRVSAPFETVVFFIIYNW